MKPKSILLLLIAFTMLYACNKTEPIQPVKNDLTGMWASSGHATTWVIDNTNGAGDNVKYTEINKTDGRYLQVDVQPNTFHETYKISAVDKTSMILLDSKSVEWDFVRVR
jgi:hypothetical protein